MTMFIWLPSHLNKFPDPPKRNFLNLALITLLALLLGVIALLLLLVPWAHNHPFAYHNEHNHSSVTSGPRAC